MLKKSTFTKTGSPAAFLPETLKRTIKNPAINRRRNVETLVYQADYQVKTYHATVRSSGNIGLAFGAGFYSFTTIHSDVFEQYNNLDYEGLLQSVVKTPNSFNTLYEDDFVCRVGVWSSIVWDGASFWLDPDQDSVKLMTDVFPKLVAAYPNLPDVPAGADGWYKVK